MLSLEHVETRLPDNPLEEYARTYPFSYSDDELPNLARGLVHHYPSHAVRQWVERFLDPSGVTPTMKLLRSITLGIREEFRYARRSEKGVQSPVETLASRRGSRRHVGVMMTGAG